MNASTPLASMTTCEVSQCLYVVERQLHRLDFEKWLIENTAYRNSASEHERDRRDCLEKQQAELMAELSARARIGKQTEEETMNLKDQARLDKHLAEDANPKDFADWLNRRGWKKREPDTLDAYLFALLKAARVLVQKVEQPSPPTTP